MADFDISSAQQEDVLTLAFSGVSTPQNAAAMTRRYFDIVLASGTKKVLADIRTLQGRLSIADTFFLLRDLPVKPAPVGIRTAVVESEKNRAYGIFLETTAANAGVEIKCFFDRAEALAWLGKPDARARDKAETA